MKDLYTCPECGYVDHDRQDGTGHWEKGSSEKWETDKSYSEWLLACNRCGVVSEMKKSTEADIISSQNKLIGEISNLAMLVRRLLRRLRDTGHAPDVCDQADNYLKAHGLEGSILR